MQLISIEKLKKLAKDEQAFEELKELFTSVQSEINSIENHLQLLEKAICNDYDSILITELNLEKPGPKIIYVNEGFTKLTGYSKEEAIGKTPRILQGPKTDRATLDRLVQSLKDGKSFFGQAVNYRKDGSEFINQWDIHPLYDQSGEISHWVSYQHDITKRKHAEISFIEAEAEFDNLIEHSNRTLVDVRFDGTIIQTNKAFRALTGFEKADLERFSFFDLVSEDDRLLALDLISNSENHSKVELILQSKQKNLIHIEIEKEAHHLQKGDIIRLIINNLSLQKKVLKSLEQRLNQLGSVIEKKTNFSYELIFDENEKPKFVYLSDGFKDLTGFEKEEFVNKPTCTLILDSSSQTKALEQWRLVKNGIDKVEELLLAHSSGKTIKILNYAQLNLVEKENGKTKVCGSMVLAED